MARSARCGEASSPRASTQPDRLLAGLDERADRLDHGRVVRGLGVLGRRRIERAEQVLLELVLGLHRLQPVGLDRVDQHVASSCSPILLAATARPTSSRPPSPKQRSIRHDPQARLFRLPVRGRDRLLARRCRGRVGFRLRDHRLRLPQHDHPGRCRGAMRAGTAQHRGGVGRGRCRYGRHRPRPLYPRRRPPISLPAGPCCASGSVPSARPPPCSSPG